MKVIAEIAQAHDGNIDRAHAFIDALACTGVDIIKFQTHIAEHESSDVEPWRIKFSRFDETRYEYWKRMEFTEEQWIGLKKHVESKFMEFLSSPFSVEAALMLNKIDVSQWKIASGEINNIQLLNFILETQKPIIVSTGMSDLNEIDRIYNKLVSSGADFTLMQCTSKYPTPLDEIGLNVMTYLKNKYSIPVGLSDHSGRVFTGIAAAVLGASILEVHVCMSKYDCGPDTAASLTVDELQTLVKGIREIEMLQRVVDKNYIAANLCDISKIFKKSLCAKCDIPAGVVLTDDMLTARKPAIGISVEKIEDIIGRKTLAPILKENFIKEEDIQ